MTKLTAHEVQLLTPEQFDELIATTPDFQLQLEYLFKRNTLDDIVITRTVLK
jgi:hypothetical protein